MSELTSGLRPSFLKLTFKRGMLILLLGFIVAFLVVAISSYRKSGVRSGTTPAIGCINNLRQIDGAIQQWAIDHQKKSDDKVTWNNIASYLRNKMKCPQGGSYTIGPVVSNMPTCSIAGHKLLL